MGSDLHFVSAKAVEGRMYPPIRTALFCGIFVMYHGVVGGRDSFEV